MRENGKKSLLTMAYYGMIILMIALIVSLFIGVTNNDVALWMRVSVIIICVLLVLVVVYTTLCMYSDTNLYTAGYALCILSVATVIVSFIFYARLTSNTEIIPLENLNVFLFTVGNLVLINLLTIAIYITGLYIKQPKEFGIKPSVQKN